VERECPLLEAVKNLDSLSREIGEKNVRMDLCLVSVCVGNAWVDAL